MLDARDAMLAADKMRFGGAQPEGHVGRVRPARHGQGRRDARRRLGRPDAELRLAAGPERHGRRFEATGAGKVYVGRYEARATPVADTLGETKLDARRHARPGHAQLLFVVARAAASSASSVTVRPGQRRTVPRRARRRTWPPATNGAKVLGASDGSLNTDALIDGTEATNWGGVNDGTTWTPTHPFVAVDLAGGVAHVRRVQVSAMLNPAPAERRPTSRWPHDPDSGSRFTALRQFALEACTSTAARATPRWKRFYTSPGRAFPARAPPAGGAEPDPALVRRPGHRAAAIRLVALENQCTGYAGYAGEQDADPTNDDRLQGRRPTGHDRARGRAAGVLSPDRRPR